MTFRNKIVKPHLCDMCACTLPLGWWVNERIEVKGTRLESSCLEDTFRYKYNHICVVASTRPGVL